jgi:cytoplasmic iron level regulating protein YaaA (DUF328/UPF0246 family)
MLTVLSPAKTLDFDRVDIPVSTTLPDFVKETSELITDLKKFSVQEISELMSLSDKLAALNVARYSTWSKKFTDENSKAAILAFNGDVYEGLNASGFNKKQMTFAQNHVRILSGLYGVLRPFDLMQAYRLEMGTSLATKKGKDLYAFWGDKITKKIQEELAIDKKPALLNLASDEYFKVIHAKALDFPIISPVFQDEKDGNFKIISFYAKKARGLMARYVIENSIHNPKDLEGFDVDGYFFVPKLSKPEKPVFQRRHK